MNTFYIGQKVTFVTPHKKEHGIVKCTDEERIFVVYNCNEEWQRYKEYTAALTPAEFLIKGWV